MNTNLHQAGQKKPWEERNLPERETKRSHLTKTPLKQRGEKSLAMEKHPGQPLGARQEPHTPQKGVLA